ncbi:hypothetical protein DWB61_03180 [Ancylomarina euxinus]|uniref:Linear amide C-N hydrolase n=1 Tax=Ancylomarina euxinus TaxID=2283627 RepID=A0A425Y6Z9_9BACT|nr:hypothetical protein [Ancylomarina euxinus]MCZ4693993.1 hypothetical protein [Ancylomarina euxinus]MUP14586.1 hypothetical protein [Ancylomarina euxinus]RRG24135.1 hypothetical protein DWB61_03180 [Ancylomarina euxinus]
MKFIKHITLLSFFLGLAYASSMACTTAVISGKSTKDGRPILWKHRDSESYQNKLRLFNDGVFTYVGLINSDDSNGDQIWGGNNEVGFAIMNSASFNLRSDKDASFRDQEGIIMKKALQSCKTLEDFENLLANLPKPMGLEANFGVIDAKGGAAYFETNDNSFVKFDANDKKVAPNGYIIRANYSFTGRENEGYGYIRYMNAEKEFFAAAGTKQLDPTFILKNQCRSLENFLTEEDVKSYQNLSENQNNFIVVKDCINRYISTSSFVIQGVKENEDPRLTTMWTLLGFPLASVAVPSWSLKNIDLPETVRADKDKNAALCIKTLELKKKFFPVSRGAGEDYMNTTAAYNKEETGIVQQLEKTENQILQLSQENLKKWRKEGINKTEMKAFYQKVDEIIKTNYKTLFEL